MDAVQPRRWTVSVICACSQHLSQPFFALLDRIEIVEAWNYIFLTHWSTGLQLDSANERQCEIMKGKRGEKWTYLQLLITSLAAKAVSTAQPWWQHWWRFQGWLTKKKQSSQKLSANLEPMANTKAVRVDTWILARNASCFLLSGYQLDLSLLLQFLFPVLLFQLLHPM